ncbi:transcriptional regulator BolA [Lonsdalea populi]|uniref:DNA-binding transcriptional regulator BolA n=1 Tax=Lonsdalea populi TaxID=1172565 RepID=A0A3N0U8T7_9GAMM|nr:MULTISPECIES: transcriptional regulator BolA [Lonsdalea]RAT17594.1 transcriptional regulator BolA [Lonsdalea quercina]RAT28015.1 transcriptional regulator BolA [Lonsdalea populi]RAT36324.1 transcriptional regulator BolA [Lonsdalea populi]RAT46818.1 transcriptional regulator BolA [Lonsdalea populi]RAT49306.1 transcriptional regulator BolA [Lonsdalea populi]
MIRETIEAKLQTGLTPEHLEVINESHRHRVPAGSESHFKVVLVSDRFDGKRLIQRHRAVYELLAEEMAGSVHALALYIYTPQEWRDQHQTAPTSPACGGAGIDR